MLKRVNYVDGTAVFLVYTEEDGDALRQAIRIHRGIRDFYEEDEMKAVKDPDNYEVIDMEDEGLMYELKYIIEEVTERSAFVSMEENIIVIQFY